jgi:hypothetical protein
MYYYFKKGQRVSGPFDFERLRECLSRGTIDAKTPIAAAIGEGGPPAAIWGPIESMLPELFRKPEEARNRSGDVTENAQEKPATTDRPPSTPVMFFAGVMVVAFFMPWVQFFGLEASGYALSKFGDEGKLVWLIPIVAGIAVLAGINGKDNRGIGVTAGVLPLVAALIGVVKLMEEAGPNASMRILDLGSNAIGIGVWLILAASIGVIWAALTSDSKAPQHLR